MQDLSFEEWKNRVDQKVSTVCGLITEDLPDQDWRGLYESGDSPAMAAKYAFEQMAEDGYPDISDLVPSDLDSDYFD